jgi:hypothetical protein
MKNTNKMAPNSRRIGFSKEQYSTREQARDAGNAYLADLEPIYQLGRSFKVVRFDDCAHLGFAGTYEFEIYLGDRPRESYR